MSRWRNRSGARPSCSRKSEPKINLNGIEELVTDKGYHSGAVVQRVKSYAVRSYIPEKKQKGRRDWQGKRAEQQAVYETGGGCGARTARAYSGGGES